MVFNMFFWLILIDGVLFLICFNGFRSGFIVFYFRGFRWAFSIR